MGKTLADPKRWLFLSTIAQAITEQHWLVPQIEVDATDIWFHASKWLNKHGVAAVLWHFMSRLEKGVKENQSYLETKDSWQWKVAGFLIKMLAGNFSTTVSKES